MDIKRYLYIIAIIATCLSGCKKSHPSSNKITIWAKNMAEWDAFKNIQMNSKDIYYLDDESSFYKHGRESREITLPECENAKSIFLSFSQSTAYKKTYLLPASHYFKQYIGYKQNGRPMVYINLFSHYQRSKQVEGKLGYKVVNMSQKIIREKNGGRDYGYALIDMSTEKVVSAKLYNK